MEYVGGAAGSTLGFIVGNVPGAVIGGTAGYNLAKNKTKKMETPSTGKRRGSNASLTGKPIKRRMSTSSNMSGVSYGSSRRGSAANVVKKLNVVVNKMKDGNQTNIVTRKKMVTKKLKAKRPSKVNVPKKLRKQILKVFESKDVHGTGRILIHGGFQLTNPSTPIKQTVYPLAMTQRTKALQKGQLFDARFLMYVASRLWNNRPAFGSGLTLGKYEDILIQKNSSATPELAWENLYPRFFDATAPDSACALKLHVKQIKAKITVRNNQNRPVYMNMYVAKPKYQRYVDDATFTDGYGLPINDWKTGLEQDADAVVGNSLAFYNNGINRPEQMDATQSSQSVYVDTMYCTPKQWQGFSKLWTYEEHKIVLEPGQVHIHWVEGDVGEYDYSKMYTKQGDGSKKFNNIQKTDRYVFFTHVNELAVHDGTTDFAGRLRSSATTPNVLIFETEIFVKMSMPEVAGGVTKVPAGDVAPVQPITNRKRGYFVDNYYDADFLTERSLNNFRDDNNPATLQGG